MKEEEKNKDEYTIKEERDDLKKTINLMEKEMDEMKKKLEAKDKEIEKFKAFIKKNAKNICGYKTSIKELEDKISKLQNELKEKTGEIILFIMEETTNLLHKKYCGKIEGGISKLQNELIQLLGATKEEAINKYEELLKNKSKEIESEKFDEYYGICPLTLKYMEHPVRSPNGRYYEKDAIFKWLEDHNDDPFTREKLSTDKLEEDLIFKIKIDEYRKKFNKF